LDSKDSEARKNTLFVRQATGLVRTLSARDAFLTSVFSMGFMWPILYLFFAGSIYQGVNLPLTVWLGLPVVLVIGFTYYLLSAAFPRSGGDYVWVSRILHPAIGFMGNFALAVTLMSVIGIVAEWFLSYGLGILFTDLSIATGNSAYQNIAATLSNTTVIFGIGVALIVFATLFNLLEVKISYRFMLGMFLILAFSLLVYFAALLSAGPLGFQNGFNKLSGTNYQAITSAATSAGFSTSFTAQGTLLGSVWTFLNYAGFASSIYVAGEMKRNDRAQLYGMLGAVIIFSLAMFAQFEISYYVMGGQFINSASLLAGSGNSAYSLPTVPVGDFLVIFANASPLVAIIVPLGLMAAALGGIAVVFPVTTRMIFAWSFDRVVPSKFSDVRGRGVPVYSVALVFAIVIFFLIVTLYTGFLSFLLYISVGFWINAALVGIAAIILPFRRKDLFATAIPSIKRKIGSVPVISVLGIATLISSLFIAYASVSPAFILTPLNPSLLGVPASIFILGLVIYYVSYYYRKSKNTDLSLVFKEIPPE
jgi:APA family basic amino acid/polyamine antiporter